MSVQTSAASKLSLVSQDIADPPYPVTTKANGFKQEVDWDRLSQSRTWIYADNEVRPWLLMLWLKSWHNVPAGSWEADSWESLITPRWEDKQKTQGA